MPSLAALPLSRSRHLAAALGIAAAAAAAAGLAAVGPAGAATPTLLRGTVGPGFTITLTDAAGKAVTSLKTGSYRLTVRDLSPSHNFALTGPGVRKATSVPATGTTTWTVTLRKGTYTFLCDPHPTSMRGTFTVTATTKAAATTNAPATTTTAASSAKVNANTASIAELAAAFTANGIPNAERWAREVDEYRPYPTDDPTFAHLRQELSKYNPSAQTLAAILASLTL